MRRVAGELRCDVRAAHERDPAARGVSSLEILASWPGVHALLAHRVAHALQDAGHAARPALDRLRQPRAHRHRDPSGGARSATGCSSTTAPASSSARPRSIGDDVTLYQGVTLGGTGFADRQAPPDGRGQRHGRLRRQAARPDHRRPRREDRRQQRRHQRRAAQQHRRRQPRARREGRRAQGRGPGRRLDPPARTRSPTRSASCRRGCGSSRSASPSWPASSAPAQVRPLRPVKGDA